jgi:hypothetical protein
MVNCPHLINNQQWKFFRELYADNKSANIHCPAHAEVLCYRDFLNKEVLRNQFIKIVFDNKLHFLKSRDEKFKKVWPIYWCVHFLETVITYCKKQ